MKLFISKSIDMEEKECAVLAILNGMYSNKNENLITSVDIIGYVMTGRFLKRSDKKDRTIIDNIRAGIKSLSDRGIIEIEDCSKDNYMFSSKGLVVDTEKELFIVIELWEMQKIFKVAKKPFNVFVFFVLLIGTLNNQTKEWHMSQDKMVEFFGGSKSTVNEYLKLLEDNKLIYVYRPKKRRTNGTFHNVNNSYGRYADKDKVISAALEYIDTVECEDVLNKINRRAIKLRYNAFCKGSKKYQDNSEAVLELYAECLKYNKSLKVAHIEGGYGETKEWKMGEELDLSVFPENVIENECWGEPDQMDKKQDFELDFEEEVIDDMENVS